MRVTPVFAVLCALASASPTPTVKESPAGANLQKRATISEVATLGYATQNGGTTGGSGGTVTTVSTLAQFTEAVDEKDATAKIVVVSGTLSGDVNVRIGSNKSVIGLKGATFDGVGLYIRRQSNVIVRNIISKNVKASTGDGIKIDESLNVWIDHCELYSELIADKDYYDGLIDASHAADWLTISYTYFHDHWKTSLVGHSENNGDEDTGHLRITYANNYWKDCGSRGPSLRFGTGHVYNSYYLNMDSAINTRQNAQILVQSNAFSNVTSPIMTKDSDIVGYAVAIDNDLGGATNTAPVGTITASDIPYTFSLLGSSQVAATVPGQAGAILSF
ncbi:pectate lyase B [Pseudomassariella vexata]|uniref:pectate lyase n=1 Tax=Pseudomassariella vexata TaxID=1141098 RepID=A0A1Y2DS54_9PEZI|nr:pectate lyase B [Pseudomassariella vexata]ORY62112.1 pectate lyase B [Pseudomassariella vexata]